MPSPIKVSWRTHVSTWFQFLTHRRLAPYHPIPSIHETFKLLNLKSSDILCDLGCGDGNTLIYAIQHYHLSYAYGYELNRQLYQVAQKNIEQADLQSQIQIYHDDALQANLQPATVILLYLSEYGNKSLLSLLSQKLKEHPDTRIVSYLFPIPTLQPIKTLISPNGKIPIRLYTGKSLSLPT